MNLESIDSFLLDNISTTKQLVKVKAIASCQSRKIISKSYSALSN